MLPLTQVDLAEFKKNPVPTKKEPKQETLEEVARTKFPYKLFVNVDVTNKQREAFIEGYKLAQERSYSEEEVKIMYRSLWVGNNFDFDTSYEMESNFEHDFNLWFEQFKKK